MATVAQIMVHLEAVFVAVVLLEVITEADSAVVLPTTAVRLIMVSLHVPALQAMVLSVVTVAAIPLNPVARAIMAAVHSEAEDSKTNLSNQIYTKRRDIPSDWDAPLIFFQYDGIDAISKILKRDNLQNYITE